MRDKEKRKGDKEEGKERQRRTKRDKNKYVL